VLAPVAAGQATEKTERLPRSFRPDGRGRRSAPSLPKKGTPQRGVPATRTVCEVHNPENIASFETAVQKQQSVSLWHSLAWVLMKKGVDQVGLAWIRFDPAFGFVWVRLTHRFGRPKPTLDRTVIGVCPVFNLGSFRKKYFCGDNPARLQFRLLRVFQRTFNRCSTSFDPAVINRTAILVMTLSQSKT